MKRSKFSEERAMRIVTNFLRQIAFRLRGGGRMLPSETARHFYPRDDYMHNSQDPRSEFGEYFLRFRARSMTFVIVLPTGETIRRRIDRYVANRLAAAPAELAAPRADG